LNGDTGEAKPLEIFCSIKIIILPAIIKPEIFLQLGGRIKEVDFFSIIHNDPPAIIVLALGSMLIEMRVLWLKGARTIQNERVIAFAIRLID